MKPIPALEDRDRRILRTCGSASLDKCAKFEFSEKCCLKVKWRAIREDNQCSSLASMHTHGCTHTFKKKKTKQLKIRHGAWRHTAQRQSYKLRSSQGHRANLRPAKEPHRPHWILPITLCFLISCFTAYRDQDPVPLS